MEDIEQINHHLSVRAIHDKAKMGDLMLFTNCTALELSNYYVDEENRDPTLTWTTLYRCIASADFPIGQIAAANWKRHYTEDPA